MSRNSKIFTTLTIFVMLALVLVPTASAFDGRGDDNVVIEADEVIKDDLYVGAATVLVEGVIQGDLYAGAQRVTIEGTITGDLVTGAETVIINGTVEGDVIAFAQSVIVNGTVQDDLRSGAAAIQLGKEASIGDDLLFGGASLESMAGSKIGGDLVVGAGQVLVTGDVGGNLLAGTSALELNGTIEGNVQAYLDPSNESGGMPPMSFGPTMHISIPYVASGITIDEAASIGGDLNYTSFTEMSFPAGVVEGETLRVEPTQADYSYEHTPPTPQQMAGFWALGLLRTIITLLALGMLMQWLFPNFLASAEYKLQTEPWQSLGWGVVAYAAFYFALIVIFTAMILGAILFGLISLGGLSGTFVALGLLTLFALVVGFILTVAYLTKIIVSVLGGKLILARVKPEWVNHKFYPLATGVIILSLFISIPLAGWVLKWIIILFALGALWLLGRDQFGKKEEALVEA
jgi:cytoskeletal protein CcmA (bactofilin family)